MSRVEPPAFLPRLWEGEVITSLRRPMPFRSTWTARRIGRVEGIRLNVAGAVRTVRYRLGAAWDALRGADPCDGDW